MMLSDSNNFDLRGALVLKRDQLSDSHEDLLVFCKPSLLICYETSNILGTHQEVRLSATYLPLAQDDQISDPEKVSKLGCEATQQEA